MEAAAGSRAGLRGWGTVAAVGAVAALRLACVTEEPPGTDDSELLTQFLAAVAPEVLVPAYEDAVAAAEALLAAAELWSQATETGGDGAAQRGAAQDAWRAAMSAWQVAETMQVGPTGSSIASVGGQDLRDSVYSWPTVNPCRVDQEIVEGAYGDPGFFDENLVNVRGLDALEYLIFQEDSDNACPGQVDINSDGSWDALGVAEITRRRAAYARTAAERLVQDAQRVVAAWSPEGEDFSAQLAAAGQSGSAYASTQQAVDELFRAMFYLELTTKDVKLGRPLGWDGCVQPNCPGPVDPSATEAPWSGHSLPNVRANIAGFRRIFVGDGGDGDDAGVGFDDLLEAAGSPGTTDAVLAGLDAAGAALDAAGDEGGTLGELLASNPERVQAIYDGIKQATDRLKDDMPLVLGLTIPQDAAGDAD
jgi:predicted lipoprotein